MKYRDILLVDDDDDDHEIFAAAAKQINDESIVASLITRPRPFKNWC